MQSLLLKINFVISSIFSKLLNNGRGRSVVTEESVTTDPSGFSLFFKSILDTIVDFLLEMGEFLLRLVARLAYFVIKIVLNIMDFMSIIIKELSGQASSYSLKGNSNFFESDILFQFLFNEVTIKILKAVFAFSILLLIIFTIMTIVKQEWQAHIDGKVASIKKVFRKVIISIFTMIITPFILIVGIVFSNVVLASALSAFSGQGGTFSIGSHIFAASSYEANLYREYASNGVKIPIVFDYDGGFENVLTTKVPEYSTESTSAQEQSLKKIKESGNFTTGQATYNMFKEENFFEFPAIYDSSTYYDMYDGPYLKTKQIEYYVMADFIDFAMQSGGIFYIVNVEEVYESAMEYIAYYGMPEENLGENATDEDKLINSTKLNNLATVLNNIQAYDTQNKDIIENLTTDYTLEKLAEDYVLGDKVIDHFKFKVYYDLDRANTLYTEGVQADGSIEYMSVANSVDEVTGAKYLFCTREAMGEDGGFIYKPVTLGLNLNATSFGSRFIEEAPEITNPEGKTFKTRSESMFLARGIFTAEGYPTAIKNEGLDISFYRHNSDVPSAINLSNVMNYMSEGEYTSSGGKGSSNLFEFITGVDISKLVPDVQMNINFLKLFTKSHYNVSYLESGRFTLNYSFANTGFGLNNVYNELNINYVVLIFACISLFMSLFYIIWGLIARLYEITLLWITMPAWISKFPLEKDENIGQGKTAFNQWKTNMIERITALFAVYVSLALILMLIPIVFGMDYITTFGIAETNLFGIFNADVANFVIKTMFVLALFAFLKVSDKKGAGTGAKMIEDFIVLSGRDQEKGFISQVGEKTFKDIKTQVNRAKGFFTPKGIYQNIKGAALNVTRTTMNAIPGKNVVDRLTNKITDPKFERRNDDMLRSSQIDLMSQTTEADIKDATERLASATHDHESMEGYRTARQDYWRKTGHNLDDKYDDKFRNRSKDKGMASYLNDVAKKGGGVKIKIGKKNIKARKHQKYTRMSRGV